MNALGRFEQGFGKRRVGVDRARQVVHGRLQAHGHDGFRDEFRHARPDHVDTEDLAVLLVAHDFDEPFTDAEDRGLAVGGEGKFPNLDLMALLARGALGQPHA